MDKKNKKNWLKKQIIFFSIILLSLFLLFLLGNFLSEYLSKHLIIPCSVGESMGTCIMRDFKYDNATATSLNHWERAYSASRFFQFIPNLRSSLAKSLAVTDGMEVMLQPLFFLIYWMAVLNIIFLLFIKIKKAVVKIKDKNKNTPR